MSNLAKRPALFTGNLALDADSGRLRRMLDRLRSAGADNARHGYCMTEWLLANSRPLKPASREIEEATREARRTHPGTAQAAL